MARRKGTKRAERAARFFEALRHQRAARRRRVAADRQHKGRLS